jgi:site-specific DNA-methyltransferase (adenine-specific)
MSKPVSPADRLSSPSYDVNGKLKDTPANRALNPSIADADSFEALKQLPSCFYSDEYSVLFCGDAQRVLTEMAQTGVKVNCAVTSPPYYGQRDYGVEGALGLERNPQDFIDKLTATFHVLKDVLSDTGSLWVNIGDTYWSGKGKATGHDGKQSARRFGKRPQDYPGDGHWMRPKQLLLIPHRLAISLQDDDWLVRNDNIWVKPNPLPDQVRDRCQTSHEHVFHFTKSRWYYFDRAAVGTPSSSGRTIAPKDTWILDTSNGRNDHKASYPFELLRIPVLATTPTNGVVLDPFVGSGTTMLYARSNGFRSIGIDISERYCTDVANALQQYGGNED